MKSWPSFNVIWISCVCVCSVTRLCPTLCYSMACSLSGSSVHGVLQVRILERVVISYPRGFSWPRTWTCVSCIFCLAGWFFTIVPPGKSWNQIETTTILDILWKTAHASTLGFQILPVGYHIPLLMQFFIKWARRLTLFKILDNFQLQNYSIRTWRNLRLNESPEILSSYTCSLVSAFPHVCYQLNKMTKNMKIEHTKQIWRS